MINNLLELVFISIIIIIFFKMGLVVYFVNCKNILKNIYLKYVLFNKFFIIDILLCLIILIFLILINLICN